MTLYDWIIEHGIGVDYWKNVISGVSNAWCVTDRESIEQYAKEGLQDSPADKEQWLNGIVIPFGVLFALKDIQIPPELENYETPTQIETIRSHAYPE